ncbi:hypothetical protein [Vulcanisaeta sp. JCM 14467]|uniref:hypothetical protein n=1 Tax=Vulcanisaeta sp. JCM 14467 TaxID=1295370 RepID=UPI0006D22E5D|nr:hypothetical protein [Vulcanisaeta sp. JCM 14467]
MGGFREEFGGIARLIGLALIVQVISMVIGVTALYLMHYLIIYVPLMALSMILLSIALMILLRVLGRVKELYLTRIRDAVHGHRTAFDVDRESRELWIDARPLVITLLIIVAASLCLWLYLLVKSLSLVLPYNLLMWADLAVLMMLSLVEVYVIARLDCAVWI